MPKNEMNRIAALRMYDILDTEAEQEFDNLAQLAAEICNAPIAFINFIDETRQWTKSSVGMSIHTMPREAGFCFYAIQDDEIFEVTNPIADARFVNSPLVTGHPGVRFYTGIPLVNKEGFRLGTLCVLSPKHHQLNSYQRISLQILTSSVMSLLELRREKKEAEFYRNVLDEIAVVALTTKDNTVQEANGWFCTMAGLKENEIIGRNYNDIKLADLTTVQSSEIQQSIEGRSIWRGIVRNQNIKGIITWCDLTVIPYVNKDNETIKILYLRRDITEEVLLRERLEESEKLAGTGRWELNIFNRVTTWTPGMFALLDGDGTTDNLKAQSIMNFVSPADYDRVNDANKKLLDKNTHGDTIEFNLRTVKGREKRVKAVVKKRYNTKGGLTGIYGTLLDISGLAPVQSLPVAVEQPTEADAESIPAPFQQENKQELLLQMPFPLVITDKDGVITAVTESFRKQFSYFNFELIDSDLFGNILRMGRQQVKSLQAELESNGKIQEQKLALFAGGGTVVDVLVSAVKLDELYVYTILQGTQTVAVSVPEKRSMPDGLLFAETDSEANLVFASPALLQILGRSEQDLKVRPFHFITDEDQRTKALNLLTKQLRSKERHSVFTFSIEKGEQSKLWLEMRGNLILNEGRVEHIEIIFNEVTERVKTEEALHEVAWIAMEAKDMQQTVMERMKHEVRNPLAGVLGMVNLLSTTPLTIEQKVLVSGIKDATGEMLNTLDHIYDVSKKQPSKHENEDSEFEVKALVDNIILTLKPDADAKNIRFTLQVDNKIPPAVIAEKDVLSKILMILAGNALKYTEKGSVSIGVFMKQQQNDVVSLEFVVKDTGVGIAQDKLETIFETFINDDRNPRMPGGAGLGLAVARQLVEQQSGELKVKSQLGIGTTFSFTYHCKLNRDAVLPEPTEQHEDDESTALNGYSILVVEDNLMNQRIAKMLLDSWGATVTVADRGQKAIDLVASGNFDIIMMDVQMPEMSGIEAATMIRGELMDNTPIIGMTVSEMQASREACLRAGMNEYILKPLKPAELHKKIFALLNKPEMKLKEMPVTNAYVKEKITNIQYLKNITSDDVHLMKEILEIYVAKTPGLLEELEINMANRAYKQAQAGAHYLKNSVGLIGADTLFHMFASLENQLNHLPPSGETYELLNKIKPIILDSIDETKDELKNL